MSVTLRFGSAPFTGAPSIPAGAVAFTPSAELVRAAVRHAVAEEIERLLAFLDALDGDPDAEPSLGWPEVSGQLVQKLGGATDDREDDAGDDREPDEDREPLLGWSEGENQAEEGPERFGEVWACDEEEDSRQPARHLTPDEAEESRQRPEGGP